jgi:hypothetical protein
LRRCAGYRVAEDWVPHFQEPRGRPRREFGQEDGLRDLLLCSTIELGEAVSWRMLGQGTYGYLEVDGTTHFGSLGRADGLQREGSPR